MENNIAISFIIPAHNAEKFLTRSVESVVKEADQTENTKVIEVIIIENGSSDHTDQLGKTLAEKYENVFLICSEKGVSNARNAGLEAAHGEWIFFLDADDYLPTGTIETLLKKMDAEETADLHIFSYEKGTDVVNVTESQRQVCYRDAAVKDGLAEMLWNPTRCMAVWGKLFRNSLIRQSSLKFNKNLSLAEDSDYLIRYIMVSSSIAFYSDVCYHYSTDVGSAMRTYDGKKAAGYLLSLQTTQQAIPVGDEQLTLAYQVYILMHFNVIMVREVFSSGNAASFSEKVKVLNNMLQKDIFNKALHAVPAGSCRSARMLPILLLKCHQYYLCGKVYELRAKQNAKREKTSGDHQ